MRHRTSWICVAACLAAWLAGAPAGADVLAVQPGCSQREYVHLGTRVLAVLDDLPTGVSVGFPTAGTTVDENAAPGFVNVPFVLTTPGPIGCPVAFEYVVTPLSATPNQDYTPPPTPWRGTFQPNQGTTVNVPITILPDAVYEADETFRVEITSVAGGVVGSIPTYLVTIHNDDPAPQLTVDDLSQPEGSGGTSTARFTLHLSAASNVQATVGYGTSDGDAVAPGDYATTSGIVTFDAGQTTRTVDVAVVGDTAYETNERFYLNLANATGATIADAQAAATLLNDDAPGLSVDEVRAVEGNAGLTGLTFTVSIEGPTPNTVTAQWATANCTADAGDYAPATGTVTFPAGTGTPQTFTVWANGDTSPEGHELFSVGLSNPVNATLKDGSGLGSIENDDAPFPDASLPTADFNRDGNPDLLWFNTTSGNLVTWEMTGVNRVNGLFLDPPAIGTMNWQVVGTPNLDADAQPDILWRNDTSGKLVVWLMNDVHRTAGLFLNPDGEADLNWRVVGTGEFAALPLGELVGSDDILFRHELTGALRVWSMNGTKRDAVFDIVPPPGPVDLHWQVIGTGDFDRDGDSDIWWRHDQTGALRVWRMNGVSYVETIVPTPGVLADMNWVSGGTPDIDRDGDPDLLWRNQVSGNLVVWLMNGTTRVCGVYLNPPNIAAGNWKLVGPR